jgi:hypothetical protein
MNRCTDLKNGLSPAPGDASLCFGCAELCIFGDDLIFRKVSNEELIRLQRSPVWDEIEMVRAAWRARRRAASSK